MQMELKKHFNCWCLVFCPNLNNILLIRPLRQEAGRQVNPITGATVLTIHNKQLALVHGPVGRGQESDDLIPIQ